MIGEIVFPQLELEHSIVMFTFVGSKTDVLPQIEYPTYF